MRPRVAADSCCWARLNVSTDTIADTVRNSLNFYRMQDSAETVDHAVLTGPAVAIPGFAGRLSEQLQSLDDKARRRLQSGLAVLTTVFSAAPMAACPPERPRKRTKVRTSS